MKKILIVNPILYTSEQKQVKRINSIMDCMIVDLCNSFVDMGYDTTLVAAEDYKPINDEMYKFNIVWMHSYLKKIFNVNKIPFNIGLKKYLKKNKFDLIIASEVFAMDTFICVRNSYKNLIIWQEMAFHQHLAKQMASKFWHNVIVKMFYKNVRIVPRTDNARMFISKYSSNVSNTIIQHGIDLGKFKANTKKNKSFVICSQLIERKKVDLSIKAFNEFLNKVSKEYSLYVIGDGDQKESLQILVEKLGITNNVIFTGKMSHGDLIAFLSKSRAMLIYTEKDNSMISIAESIAVCTPVITTSVPDNAMVIEQNGLGIVRDDWSWKDMQNIIEQNEIYVNNCMQYRDKLDNRYNVKLFMDESKCLHE